MNLAPGTGFQRQKGFDMLVLGGGIAGLTAAWRGASLGISVALIEQGLQFGGQVGTLGVIDDYPAVTDQSGAELAAGMLTSVRTSGAAVSEDTVIGIGRDSSHLVVETREHFLRARSVVIATGARLRKLELSGASQFEGRGLSQCATCDGAFFRNEPVVVIGGGDAALQAALQLSKTSRTVAVVVRGRLRARQTYIDAATQRSNLQFLWDSEVESIIGDDGIKSVLVRNRKNGEAAEVPCSGVFPHIGVEPNSEFAAAVCERTPAGHIRTKLDFETSLPEVYAIGAVREGFSGALISAAGEGAAVAEAIAARRRI